MIIMRRNVTLYLDLDLFQAYRKKIDPKPVSRDLEDLMRKSLADATIESPGKDKPVDYASLRRGYEKASADAERLEKKLRKRRAFDDLTKLAMSLGIVDPEDLAKLNEVAPKLQEAWKGSIDAAQIFIFYLEAMKAKSDFLTKLNEVRAARI